jgi:hypothetical protein
MGNMTRVPIACSLTEALAGDRVREWQAFVADHVDSASRDAAEVRLRLRPGKQTLVTAIDLAAREKACCPFFSFALDIEADGSWLRITVPEDASAVLDDFAGLLLGSLDRGCATAPARDDRS